jgi:hypothetical protein
MQNVLRSTLLHANKTIKKCIQFLNKSSLGMLYGGKSTLKIFVTENHEYEMFVIITTNSFPVLCFIALLIFNEYR